MNTLTLSENGGVRITPGALRDTLKKALSGRTVRKALLLPPDITRMNSFAGPITRIAYELLTEAGAQVEIMPALGTHQPMTEEEIAGMYPGVPASLFRVHRWREDVVRIGTVPAEFIEEISEGYYSEPVEIELNRRLLDPSLDLILSIGQVVPHEVVGMANYSKNLFVGCGGSGLINKSHYIGALYGMERMMGRDHSPVHRLFDYAQEHFLKGLPVLYALTVTTADEEGARLRFLSVGDGRDAFEKAVEQSQRFNLTLLDRPLQRVVVFLDEREFKTTWLANKSIYRTRMAIADGGELLVIAPGLRGCGEDPENDRLIRKYGYVGRDAICRKTRENAELRDNLSVAAHIIHSSGEGRFSITYAPGHMTEEEIRGISYGYMPLGEAQSRYPAHRLEPGMNLIDGEEVFCVKNPALGLWALRERFC